MPKATLSSHFDYTTGSGQKMYSYPAGDYEDMPQAHYDAAVAAGKVKGVDAPAEDSGKASATSAKGGK